MPKQLSVKAKEIVKSKKTNFFPSNWSKTYFQWMNNIEPWCISRDSFGGGIKYQLGMVRIKKIFVATNENEAKVEAKKFYNKDVDLIRDLRCIRYLVFIRSMAFCYFGLA